MAIGTKADFKIYDEQYFGGAYEALSQNVAVFNEKSGGAITLVANKVRGDYERISFMKELSSLITHRDPTSVAAATDQKLTQGEQIGVKVNKQIGPVAGTLDEWKKINEDPELMSFYFGQAAGTQKLLNMVNTTILAAFAAISGVAAVKNDISASGTATQSALVDTLAKFGDMAQNVNCWVGHSKVYFDLVKEAIAAKIFGVANITIYEGTVATLGRPFIAIDAPALLTAGAPNHYNTLGLVGGAAECKESEDETIFSQMVTGLANLAMRVQGEYAYNLRLKGYAYATAAGVNPNDTTVGTAANWTQVATNVKQTAGVILISQ